MSNWCGIPAYKCKDLTLQAAQDCLNQDIETNVLVIDNSPDRELHDALMALQEPRITICDNEGVNLGVAASWNAICAFVFGIEEAEHVLIINNDIRLRPDTYRHLLIPSGGFVTAINAPQHFDAPELTITKGPYMSGPDFSCFLIHKWFSEACGPFNEDYKIGYFEDRDFHNVAISKSLATSIYSVPIPYLHLGSQSIKQNPELRLANDLQFPINQQLFISRWGGLPHHETFKTPFNQ